jgi:Dickkopf N-terminal cysteine-rich region
MRNLTRTLTLTVAPLMTLALGGLVVACTETTVVPPALDASSSTDGGPGKDDGGTTDGGPGKDDSGPGTDGGKADGGKVDGGNDGGPIAISATEFATKNADAYCTRAGTCCAGTTFAKSVCVGVTKEGYEGPLTGAFVPGVNVANIVIDSAKANSCLGKLASLTCRNTTDTPSAEQQDVVKTCASAISGKLAVDQACTHDIECQRGNFCEGSFNAATSTHTAGGGFCKPLKAIGDACTRTDAFRGNNCSYLGAGENGNTCGIGGVCIALVANGGTCINSNNAYNLACASMVCNETTAGENLCGPTLLKTPQWCLDYAP